MEMHRPMAMWRDQFGLCYCDGSILLGIYLAWLMYGKQSVSRDWLTGKYQLLIAFYTINILLMRFYQYSVVAGDKVLVFS